MKAVAIQEPKDAPSELADNQSQLTEAYLSEEVRTLSARLAEALKRPPARRPPAIACPGAPYPSSGGQG